MKGIKKILVSLLHCVCIFYSGSSAILAIFVASKEGEKTIYPAGERGEKGKKKEKTEAPHLTYYLYTFLQGERADWLYVMTNRLIFFSFSSNQRNKFYPSISNKPRHPDFPPPGLCLETGTGCAKGN